MSHQLIIENTDNGNYINVTLHSSPVPFSADSILSDVIEEGGHYNLVLRLDGYSQQIDSISILLNDAEIGECEYIKTSDNDCETAELKIRLLPVLPGKNQPFLLHYDILSFSVRLCIDSAVETWFSAYYMCLSANDTYAKNAEAMMRTLLEFDDSSINTWVFGLSQQATSFGNSIIAGGLHKDSWKSFSSYVQIMEQICSCYKMWLPYFRTKASHVIVANGVRVPYSKVRAVTSQGFQWLMQNSDQLSPISAETGIAHNGQHYIPISMLSPQLHKVMNTYENQIILSFLYSICGEAKRVCLSLQESLSNEKIILKRINRIVVNVKKGSPIIAFKTYQLSFYERNLTMLIGIKHQLEILYRQYESVLDCTVIKLSSFPHKTKKFQEIDAYNQIFECIVRWYKFGDFSLEKELMLLRVKTLDKLFEYFCLLTLLSALKTHDYSPKEVNNDIVSHEYHTDDDTDPNEHDVANTYHLYCGETEIDIYYQPVVFSYKLENGLSLFRSSTIGRQDARPYYTPDFIIGIQKNDAAPEYIVMDSKYSSQASIRQYALEDALQKYYCQMDSAITKVKPIKAVWLLQGRTDENSESYRFTNTLIAQSMSLQIIPINPDTQAPSQFWRELSTFIN